MKNETAIFILLKSLTSHAFHPSRYFLLSSLLLHLSLRRIIVVHTLGLSLGPRETHRKRDHELSFSDPFNFPFHWNQRLALPPFVEEHSNHCCDTLSIRIIFIVRLCRSCRTMQMRAFHLSRTSSFRWRFEIKRLEFVSKGKQFQSCVCYRLLNNNNKYHSDR